jgi:hypothetical protein
MFYIMAWPLFLGCLALSLFWDAFWDKPLFARGAWQRRALSAALFCSWAYALGGPFALVGWYQPTVAAWLLLGVTALSVLLPQKEPGRPETAELVPWRQPVERLGPPFESLWKYVPVESLTLYLAMSGVLPGLAGEAERPLWFFFSLCLLFTWVYHLFYLRLSGWQVRWWELVLPTAAFAVWAYAFGGPPFANAGLYSPELGSLLLGGFTFAVDWVMNRNAALSPGKSQAGPVTESVRQLTKEDFDQETLRALAADLESIKHAPPEKSLDLPLTRFWEEETYLDRVRKYFPAQTFAVYVAAVVVFSPGPGLWFDWAVFLAWLMLTPLMRYLDRRAWDGVPPPPSLIVLPTIAYVVWSFGIGGRPLALLDWFPPLLAPLLLLGFTWGSGLVRQPFGWRFRILGVAVWATPPRGVGPTRLERAAMCVPAEILAAYVGLLALAGELEYGREGYLWGVFFGCLGSTVTVQAGRATPLRRLLPAVAFVVWAYALGGGPFRLSGWYQPVVASLLLLGFTLVTIYLNPPREDMRHPVTGFPTSQRTDA